MKWQGPAILICGIALLIATVITYTTCPEVKFDKLFLVGFVMAIACSILGAREVATRASHRDFSPNWAAVAACTIISGYVIFLLKPSIAGESAAYLFMHFILGLLCFIFPFVLFSTMAAEWHKDASQALEDSKPRAVQAVLRNNKEVTITNDGTEKNFTIGLLTNPREASKLFQKSIECQMYSYPDGEPALLVIEGGRVRVWLKPAAIAALEGRFSA